MCSFWKDIDEDVSAYIYSHNFPFLLLPANKLSHFYSLVSGAVKGNFKLLFNRVGNIIRKNGPFDVSQKFAKECERYNFGASGFIRH